MKCKEAHLLIAGLTGNELPEELVEHTKNCSSCANLIQSDAQFRMATRALPSPNLDVMARVRVAIVDRPVPQVVPWLEFLRRNTLMKITLPAAAVLATALFLGLPRPAGASQPLATFRKMKSAVLAKAKDMTHLGLKIGQKPDGSLGSWVVVDGELTELQSNTPFHINNEGNDITAITDTSSLDSLPPELRAQVEAQIAKYMRGEPTDPGTSVTTSTSATVDGKPVDIATVKDILKQNGIDLNLDIDLNETHYQAINYGNGGKDTNTLVLTPKSSKYRHLVVKLDGKTKLPKLVRLEELKHGSWVDVRHSNVTLL